MMSSLQSLEAEWLSHQKRYRELKLSFQRSCEAIPRIPDPHEREQVMQSATQKMHEMEDLLETMKSDLRALPTRHKSSKSQFQREWHACSKQYASLKEEYRKSASKHRLLSMEPHSKYERERLLQSQDMMDHMRAKSAQSLQLLAESESIGLNVSQSLHSQGQQLDQIHMHLQEVNSISERAQRLMKGMKTKVYTDRLLQTLIVCIELVIIVFLLWWKFRKDL
mmetsp:Transcript_6020/g.9976  ORF Transcript_6020/g.9976 Transcript_6020/m.9976 type:complete len:223 (-) Transcript_6020:166-834(-)